jgi:hypothetical protein
VAAVVTSYSVDVDVAFPLVDVAFPPVGSGTTEYDSVCVEFCGPGLE